MAKLSKNSFGVNSKMLIAESEESGVSKDIYRPNILKGNQSSYTSVLKFLPWHDDTDLSIVKKWVVFITNPTSNEIRNFDCPTTLGKTTPSIFQTAFFALRESQLASLRDLQTKFKRSRQFFSLVQIIQDEQHPELNGELKIFQYTQQVYEKLKLMIDPESSFDEENDPFDLFSGKLFNLNIKIKTEGKNKYPDYTASKFLDKTHGVIIDGKQYKSEDDIEEIIEFLEKNSPDLKQHFYKPLTQDNKVFIANVILETIPEGEELSKIIKSHPEFFNDINNSPSKSKSKAKAKPEMDYDDDDDDDDDDEEEEIVKPSKKKSEPAPKKSSKKVVEDDDDVFIDDDEEDEEEEIVKPSKKKSEPAPKKSSKKVVEEEDDDDDDDEEEEIVKPSKKKSEPAPKKSSKKVVEDDDDDDFSDFDL